MSKPKYINILTSLFFCSVVASSTLHFSSFFSVNNLARGNFWYDKYGLWLDKPSPDQKFYLIFEVLHLIGVVFGTASVVQTINKYLLDGHLLPIKENHFQGVGPLL